MEACRDGGGVQRLAVLLGEDAAGFLVSLAPDLPLAVLPLLVRPQCGHGAGVEGEEPVAGFRFRLALDDLPPVLYQLTTDGHQTRGQVHVLPGNAARLTAAEAAVGDNMPEGVEAVVVSVIEESS